MHNLACKMPMRALRMRTGPLTKYELSTADSAMKDVREADEQKAQQQRRMLSMQSAVRGGLGRNLARAKKRRAKKKKLATEAQSMVRNERKKRQLKINAADTASTAARKAADAVAGLREGEGARVSKIVGDAMIKNSNINKIITQTINQYDTLATEINNVRGDDKEKAFSGSRNR